MRRLYSLFTWLSLSIIVTLSVLIWTLIFSLAYLFTNPHIHNTLWPHIAHWTNHQIQVASSQGQLYRGLTLNGIQIDLGDTRIELAHAHFKWQPLALLKGQLHLEELVLNQGQVYINETAQASDEPAPLDAPFAPIIAWQALINLRVDLIRLQDMTLYQAEQSYPLQQFKTGFHWHKTQLNLHHLTLDYAPYQFKTQGKIRILDAQHLSGELDNELRGLDSPFDLIAFNLHWQGGLTEQNLGVTLHQPYQFNSQHRLKQDNNQTWLIESDWQNLQATLTDEQTLTLVGAHSAFQLSADLALNGQIQMDALALNELRIASQQLQFKTTPDFAELHFDSQTEFNETAALTLQGQFSLEAQQLNIDGQLVDLNLSHFVPDLDTGLNSRFQLNWHGTTQPILNLDIQQLSLQHAQDEPIYFQGQLSHRQTAQHEIELKQGQLRHGRYQGKAQAQVTLAPDFQQGQLHQAQFTLGNNQLHASGKWGDNTRLNVTGSLKQLDQLWPGLQGALQLQFDTQGHLANRALTSRLQLQTDALHYDEISLTQGRLNTTFNPFSPLEAKIELHLSQLQQGENIWLQQLDWTRQKTAQHWQNQLHLTHPHIRFELDLNETHPAFNKGTFDVIKLAIYSEHTGNWHLPQAWQLRWLGDTHFESSRACLQHQDTQAALCWQLLAPQRAQWQMTDWPIFDWLSPLLTDEVSLNGVLSGEGQANWQSSWSLQQQIQSDAIDVNLMAKGYVIPLSIAQLTLNLDAKADSLHLSSAAKLNQSGHWQFHTDITNQHQAWSNAKIDGQLEIQLNEWPLTDSLQNLVTLNHTALHLQSRLSGKLDSPEHQTQANLDVGFDLPIIGLQKQKISLNARLDENAIQGQGQWLQPNGQADMALQLTSLQQTPRIQAQLNSAQFNIMNTPFAEVNAASEINFEWFDNAWKLGGKIDVQNTEINLEAMPSPQQQTTLSRDGIVYDKDNQVIQGDAPFNGHLDLAVNFKQNVTIKLRDAQVQLGGGIQLNQLPQTHDVRVFGQLQLVGGHLMLDSRNRIEIDASNIIFNGVAGNPTLDVNLSRLVERTQARLNISGTATQPNFTFYSTPPLSQARVINLFIFGRAVDSDNEPNYQSQVISALYKLGLQNNTPGLSQLTQTLGIEDIYFDIRDQQSSNLILGRALTDELYIRYVMGLGNQKNDAIEMIFKLSPKWSIESRNSDDASSGDIIFRQER